MQLNDNNLAETVILFLKEKLPDHYNIIHEDGGLAPIHCLSSIGLDHYDKDVNRWNGIIKGLSQRFGERVAGINHNIFWYHKDFTVHLRGMKEITGLLFTNARIIN